ncbi:unnamed protein product [Lactuca virosa]|uniref:Alpha/beta hydrolase fold-3 domain-containing protein n=1 Tax=Lactuca virosa TaxID=75947 RepID=A0AAU9M921_9ASTR|nr:unnamed protein product [Lactuca virosa]
MPSVAVKLYSVFFKLILKRRLQNRIQNPNLNDETNSSFGVTSRPEETIVAANPLFTDGVATKDIHIDPSSCLSIRIFLPETYGSADAYSVSATPSNRRSSYCNGFSTDDLNLKSENGVYRAVGYRLAPENRYPAAFEDGIKVLHWLAKQANLAECGKSLGRSPDSRKSDVQGHIADAFGASLVEPWLAAHGDPSRCVLLGVSCGANIADYVARKSVESAKQLDPVKVVAQVLMYPFFIGNTPTRSEIKLSNSYFFDKSMSILAWKLFLPEEQFNLDHPAANPLITNRGGPPLKRMPPTLTVVAEHDWMRDRAIAYAQELKKVNVDAPVLDYKDCVHEFATLDMLLRTPEAQACAEDIAIWVKKYISLRGHEFSY